MWAIIKANRRKSFLLFLLMGIVLIALGFIIGSYINPESGGFGGIFIAALIWAIMSLISYYQGANIMLSVSGAREVTPDVAPQLYNVVEEMKIAANLPVMPKVYIIPEEAPNAFATGRDPQHAAVAVTAGLLARMNRDELQGVIAHEISHIVNRDIRFMTLAGIMVGSIVLISEIFLRSLFYSSASRYRSKEGGQGQLILMIVAIVFAILAPILAQLLYFAISRKREYLADASAARFTRYPEGLASALEKISQSTEELRTANKVTAPLYIANPLKEKGKKLNDLTSTHPPISERIRILRSLQYGASYNDYQQAYSKVTGKSGIIPGSEIKGADAVGLREGMAAPVAAAAPVKDVRQKVNNIMAAVNDYRVINCSCGIRLKVPPAYKQSSVKCPRCGKEHALD